LNEKETQIKQLHREHKEEIATNDERIFQLKEEQSKIEQKCNEKMVKSAKASQIEIDRLIDRLSNTELELTHKIKEIELEQLKQMQDKNQKQRTLSIN